MFLKLGREMIEPSGRSLLSIDQGNVKFARSASYDVVNPTITDLRERFGLTGLPNVLNSQSRIPMTRFSVGWKIILSSL